MQTAARFKAMAHPVRVQMLALISRTNGQLCVCEIEAHFDLAQPTISHHLKILRQANLIACERRGQWLYYAIAPQALGEIQRFVAELMTPK